MNWNPELKAAIEVKETETDPPYLQADPSFGDPTKYQLFAGKGGLPLLPSFREYGIKQVSNEKTEQNCLLDNCFYYENVERKTDEKEDEELAAFITNITVPGWYPPKILTTQHRDWVQLRKVQDAIFQRFKTALHRRPVVHPAFIKKRTVYRLSVFQDQDTGKIGVMYYSFAFGGTITTGPVPQDALLGGSMWHDVEYHERHNTPEA
jgi:hypothetical protein